MLSTWMMVALIAFYALVSLVSGIEGNWPRCLYWIGAGLITIAVIWGTK